MKSMKGNAFDQVREFHAAFNHPIGRENEPSILTEERRKTRAKWMKEEVNEFVDSEEIHLQVDALIDLIYFALGSLVEMGVRPETPWDIVQQANMNKLGPNGKPIYYADGKVKKPDGWVAPDQRLFDYFNNQDYRKKYLIIGGVSIFACKIKTFTFMGLYNALEYYPEWLKVTSFRPKISIQGYLCALLHEIDRCKEINMTGDDCFGQLLSYFGKSKIDYFFSPEGKFVKLYNDLPEEERSYSS